MRPSASPGCRGQAPADAAAESCEGDGGPSSGPQVSATGRSGDRSDSWGAEGCWITSSTRSSSDGRIVRAQPRHGQSYQ